MSEIINEKNTTADSSAADTPVSSEHGISETTARPKGKPWMYRTFQLGPITFPAFASPPFQIGFVALVCFLCPGMFNAVNGLGAGGGVSAHDINNANTALYATFAGVGFFAGSIANRIGLRLTLGIGGFGYFLYIGSILSYNHNGNAGFLIFAGALLGLCAGMLWTAQGAVMMSYPLEKSKGKYIAWFWMIFNLGGVIGALVRKPPTQAGLAS
jgi:MFS family permease